MLLTSCRDSSGPDAALLQEIKGLTTIESQTIYLENIYNKYIELRKLETEAWNSYGRNSDSYNELVNDHKPIDDEYLQKIEVYLDTHGHPSIVKHGRLSAYIPTIQTVQSDNIDVLMANYKYLNDAYLFNDIPGEMFYKYLLEIYRKKEKERYLPSPDFGVDENIEALRSSLNLDVK